MSITARIQVSFFILIFPFFVFVFLIMKKEPCGSLFLKFPSPRVCVWGVDVGGYEALVYRSVPPAKLIFIKSFRRRDDIGYHPCAVLVLDFYPQVRCMVGVVGLGIP